MFSESDSNPSNMQETYYAVGPTICTCFKIRRQLLGSKVRSQNINCTLSCCLSILTVFLFDKFSKFFSINSRKAIWAVTIHAMEHSPCVCIGRHVCLLTIVYRPVGYKFDAQLGVFYRFIDFDDLFLGKLGATLGVYFPCCKIGNQRPTAYCITRMRIQTRY